MTPTEATCCVCGVVGTKGVTLVMVGGHEPGSQAPDARWYCTKMNECLRRTEFRDINRRADQRKRM